MQDYYEILNVPKTVSVEDISKSYKKLALQCHPDVIPRNLRIKNPQVTDETICQAVLVGLERFKDLSHAYSILSDPEKRRLYDSGANPLQEKNDRWDEFDRFFNNFPIGSHIDRASFKNMLTNIYQKLDQTLIKSQGDCRYQKIAVVIVTLKQDLSAAEPRDDDLNLNTIAPEVDIIPGIKVYQFLLDAQIAIQKAKATQEPETHRGVLLGTPILRELTLLGLAICRFIVFAVLKLKCYFDSDTRPVFKEGMCHGLFKPPKTRTLYYLDSFENELHHHENRILSSINVFSDHGKGRSFLCFYPKDEYFAEEIFNFSM